MAKQLKKVFILDTNVLLHDPNAILLFENNYVYIPMTVLEELDRHKVGQNDLNRNARAATRLLEQVSHLPGSFSKGFNLAHIPGSTSSGKLFLVEDQIDQSLGLDTSIADNRILSTAIALKKKHSQLSVILVSKDINLRVKARSRNIDAADYLHDHAIDDADLLYQGYRELSDEAFSLQLDPQSSCAFSNGKNYYYMQQDPSQPLQLNEFIATSSGMLLRVHAVDGNKVSLHQIFMRQSPRTAVCGIHPKNFEQNYALELLLDPTIDFVTLLGPAGTGKTLLTLAAALQQTIVDKLYSEIIFTRATVPMGEEIGFLPGSEEDKIGAWMGALSDNLEVLTELNKGKAKGKGVEWTNQELLSQFVKIKAMTFMRGRTFQNKFLIIDEAQNLTPKQIKALITRAGEGTKVVCMGNLSQIDTPYLGETSSGLTYAVEAFKGWEHFGHLILSKGERSRLASYANDNC